MRGIVEVRKSQKSAANRIASIREDAEFVQQVAEIYGKPLVANRRAGLWYVPPAHKAAESYFKSTDGHINQWQFSLKRLNLHLIPLVEQGGGVIIVDTTRRGKRMPDALSKTVPIWCAVLNKVLLGVDLLALPRLCVSKSEQDRIVAELPRFIEQFRHNVDATLWPQLSKPLRPLFVTPNEALPDEPINEIYTDAHAVICVTASKQAQDGELVMNGYAYVQGAADDHESWAPPQFSPEMLWMPENANLHERGLGDEELRRRITAAAMPQEAARAPLKLTGAIAVANQGGDWTRRYGKVVDLTSGDWTLAPGKKGAKQLQMILPEICKYFESSSSEDKASFTPESISRRGVESPTAKPDEMLVIQPERGTHTRPVVRVPHSEDHPVLACEETKGSAPQIDTPQTEVTLVIGPDGTDFAHCVALMLDCRYFTADGQRRPRPKLYVSKEEVTQRNTVLIARSGSPPSRATQNVVGAFLRK